MLQIAYCARNFVLEVIIIQQEVLQTASARASATPSAEHPTDCVYIVNKIICFIGFGKASQVADLGRD